MNDPHADDQTQWGAPEGSSSLDPEIVTDDRVAGRWLDVMSGDGAIGRSAPDGPPDEDLRIVEAVASRIEMIPAHLVDHELRGQVAEVTGLDPDALIEGRTAADDLKAARARTRTRVSDGDLNDTERDWALVLHLMVTAEAAGRHGLRLGSRSPEVLRPYLVEIAAVLPERWTGGLLAAIEA